MERKIGEIFELGGEWYQCVESDSCGECSLFTTECGSGTKSDLADKVFGQCSKVRRTDNKHVIFKKLEKWGGPYPNADKLYQLYRLPMNIEKLPPHTEGINLVRFDIVEIEIKQNKEDMEDLDKIKVRDYTKVEELNVMEEKKLNLKPFDIQKAREGKPVCTRDGRKARIICFDRKGGTPIVGLIQEDGFETVATFTESGLCLINGAYNLMMLPEKKEGWVNVYKERVYKSKEEAVKNKYDGCTYIDTIKVEWEE